MRLNVPTHYLKTIDPGLKNPAISRVVLYSHRDEAVEIKVSDLSDEQLSHLEKLVQVGKDKKEKGALGLCQKLSTYRRLKSDPGGEGIGRLEHLATAAKEYIGKSEHKWLFSENTDGQMVPFFVSNIHYTPADPRHQSPACTEVSLVSPSRGSRDDSSMHFYQGDLQGKTVVALLSAKGFFLETPAMIEAYLKEIELYHNMHTKTGEQYLAVGKGYEYDSYYSRGIVAMLREDVPTKVVIDDLADEEEDSRRDKTVVSGSFWSKKTHTEFSGDEMDDNVVACPVHPYIKVFDLSEHQYVKMHVNYLSPYQYDSTLINKLVLPKQKKDLVGILVQGSSEMLGDIIQGKMKGIIVIATGHPGTGKTLTAEVFSEEIKRPLYVVQCSQLGTDEDKVEKKLKEVLARAARWKAILLIDEADVYIHERGSNIQQNAIVGVFLRVLEYYRGVLFMTSNRATIIDDAIMSRATAWIKYDIPNTEELNQIWKVLADKFNIALDQATIDLLIEEFPKLSGRNVRNLLKLAKLLAIRKKKKVDFELIKYVAQFQDLDAANI